MIQLSLIVSLTFNSVLLICTFVYHAKLSHARREIAKEIIPMCGCGHHMSYHDPRTGKCGNEKAVFDETRDVIRDSENEPARDPGGYIKTIRSKTFSRSEKCGCQRYIGPEPMSTIYSPELATGVSVEVTSDQTE